MDSTKPFNLPDDSSIPRLAEWLEQEPLKTRLAEELAEVTSLKLRENENYKLVVACAENDTAKAEAIMHEHGWNGTSFPSPNAESWHKECSLMFYACWGNEKCTPTLYYKLFLFLAEYDPTSVLSSTSTGGSMLHAMLNGNADPVMVNELLERGVNPWRKNKDGHTYLDRMQMAFSRAFPEGRVETIDEYDVKYGKLCPSVPIDIRYQFHYENYESYVTVISLVKNFMAQHPEAECIAREEEIKRKYSAVGNWAARTEQSRSSVIARE